MSFSKFFSNVFSDKKAFPLATFSPDLDRLHQNSKGSWDALHIAGLEVLATGKAVPIMFLSQSERVAFQSYFDAGLAQYAYDEKGAEYMYARSLTKVAKYLETNYGIAAPEPVMLGDDNDVRSIVLGYDPEKMRKAELAASVKAQKAARKQSRPSV